MGELTEEVNNEWPVWRLIFDGGQTLEEVDSWDYEDIMKANAILDMRDDYGTAIRQYNIDKIPKPKRGRR
ncbi:MAG: hypothetical protein ACFFDT_04155 [Candidatus Hodarchaeota archaeon]